MTNLLIIIQKPKIFFGKIFLVVLLFVSSVGQVRAQSSTKLWQLHDGPLTSELWDAVLGDLNDWQVIRGRLQGHLLPPPTVSNYRSAVAPRLALWPVTGNYQFAFDFIALDGAEKNFGVLFNHKLNSQRKLLLSYISFNFVNKKLYIKTYKDNFPTHKTFMIYSLIPGKTYRIQIIYQKPDFQIFIDEQVFFSTKNDDGFWPDFLQPGRPFFYLTKGEHEQSAVIYNNFKLTFFPQLSVPYFSQLDFNWADEVYDHSQEFFDPPLTIASSGCALTSAAMLINYYGYDTFPDQENFLSELRAKDINPATLNTWLNNEADGYVGVSLVNWLAVTRLTSLLAASATEAKQSLEFNYASYQTQEINDQLTAGQPLIADVDGHFVVITGVSDENQDDTSDHYLINDPASTDSALDQEQTPIQSLRLFTPSQTDLSYWLLISPEELDFQVINDEQHNLLPTVVKEKNLLNPARPWFLYYWPKPESGNYFWQLSPTDLEKLNLSQLFVYQNTGQVQIFNLVDYTARELRLNYAKDQLSELSISKEQQIFLHYHRYLLNHLVRQQKEQLILGRADYGHFYQQLIERFLAFYQL